MGTGKGMQSNQKLKPYLVYKYLLENSDENNCISAENIAAYLTEAFGVPAERRSIYKDIESINIMLYAAKYDILIDEAISEIKDIEDDSWQSIVYDGSKKGFYVKRRYFDIDKEYSLNDIKTIAECIYSSKFITEANAKKYVDIITEVLLSCNQAEEVKHDALLLDRGKTISAEVFKNIQKINKAMQIKTGKNKHTPEKISFKYLTTTIKGTTERRNGESYIVSPYRIVINEGFYYLLGYDDKLAATRTYRIDRMKDIRLLAVPREGAELFQSIDQKALAMQNFGMFDGKKEYVTLRFINPLLDIIIDKFGSKIYYHAVDDKHFSVQVQVPITDQFFGWLCGLGRRVKIISPQPVQDKFKEYLEKIKDMY